MKCRFFLLDVDEARDAEKPTVRIWGIDDSGNRIVVLASQIKPYFYIVPAKDRDLESVRKRVCKPSEKSEITEFTEVSKKILGKERTVLKTTCSNYEMVNRYAEEI